MSLNKVLNRPMFRREALRRGALKPIRANTGISVGSNNYASLIGDFKPLSYNQPAPGSKYSQFPGRTFQYDTRGDFRLNPRVASKIGKFTKGLGLQGLLYGNVAELSPTAAGVMMGSEILGAGLNMSKKPSMQLASKIFSAPTRFAFSRPGITALGLGAYNVGKGGYDYLNERDLVKEYAKAKNIDEGRALNIFERDLAGEGGRPITDFKRSDIFKTINKYLAVSPSAAMKVAKPLSDKTAPGQKSEKDIANEIRGYVNYVQSGGSRVYQDVDTLVKKYKEQDEQRFGVADDEIMIPEDEMMQQQRANAATNKARTAAETLVEKIMVEQGVDVDRASNLAFALVNGDMNETDLKDAATTDSGYEKIPNYNNDPNHPKTKKLAKAEEQIEKNVGDGTKQDNITVTPEKTGDNDIDRGKDLATKLNIAELLKDPRPTQMDPQRVFLMKLAAGLLSGKTMRGGFAGLAEVFGAALGPAVDAKALVKMKNDEAYRDWATTVLSYNTELLKARNDLVKLNKIPGAFQTRDGIFQEAFRDKDTGNIFVVNQAGDYVPVGEQEGQFFEQKSDAKYFDNLKLIADGYMSTRLLADSIALMETQQGKTAIGASGLITNLVDIVSKLPGELKDGLFSTGAFTQTGVGEDEKYDKRGKLRKFENFDESTQRVLGDLEEGLEEFLAKNPSASDVLGKLRVNARMLTYSLANSLKEKDRLTNRDLELIEDLTKTLTTNMTDDKIVAQYKELLKEVVRKNNIRVAKLGTMGYTQADITGLLGSSGLGVYAQERIQKAPDVKTLEEAFNELMGIQ